MWSRTQINLPHFWLSWYFIGRWWRLMEGSNGRVRWWRLMVEADVGIQWSMLMVETDCGGRWWRPMVHGGRWWRPMDESNGWGRWWMISWIGWSRPMVVFDVFNMFPFYFIHEQYKIYIIVLNKIGLSLFPVNRFRCIGSDDSSVTYAVCY